METSQASGGKCSCACHKMLGLFIALIGLTFLLKSLDVVSPRAAGIIWPFLVLLMGIQIVFRNKCKCCTAT